MTEEKMTSNSVYTMYLINDSIASTALRPLTFYSVTTICFSLDLQLASLLLQLCFLCLLFEQIVCFLTRLMNCACNSCRARKQRGRHSLLFACLRGSAVFDSPSNFVRLGRYINNWLLCIPTYRSSIDLRQAGEKRPFDSLECDYSNIY